MIMEQQPQSVQTGQRLFLLGLFAVIGVEAAYTVVTASKWFEWTSLLMGIVAFLGTLYLTNRLYDGDQQALSWLRILACTVLVLLAVGLVLFLAGYVRPARLLAVNVIWLTCVKMAVYGLFAAVLFSPGDFADFLASRRGETIERALPSGPLLELPGDQAQAVGNIMGRMRAAGVVLVIAGAIEVLLGLRLAGPSATTVEPEWTSAKSLLDLISGFATLCLGAMLITTSGGFHHLLHLAERNTGHLAQTLEGLGTFFKAQIILGLIAGGVLVFRMMYFLF